MKAYFAAALAPLLVLTACSTEPKLPVLTSGPAPDDASAGLRRVSGGNPVGDYHHREPVDPGKWRKLNDEQSPGGAE